MEIQMNRLGCDKAKLLNLVDILTHIKSGSMHIEARNDVLVLRGYNDKRRYLDRSAFDYVAIEIPYTPKEQYNCYTRVASFIDSIKKAEKEIVVLTSGKPLGWELEDAVYTFKKAPRKEIRAFPVKRALDFLLSLSLDSQNSRYRGIVMNGPEMVASDRASLHIQTSMETLSNSPELLGIDAASGLRRTLDHFDFGTISATYVKSQRSFSFCMRQQDGVGIYITSRPIKDTSSLEEARPSITPDSIGFGVHTEFIETVCKTILEQVKVSHGAVVYLHAALDQLHYTAFKIRMSDGNRTAVYQGTLPMVRTFPNTGEVAFGLQARRLLNAIEGKGGTTQFIVPCHPETGFEFYPISPIYVNCAPDQFAVIAPYVLDNDLEDALRQRAKERFTGVKE